MRKLAKTQQRWTKWVLLFPCVIITIAILLAGLWPFQFHPKNDVTWVNEHNGIHFGRRGIAYIPRSVYGPHGPIHPGRPVSIELAVIPKKKRNDSISRILTLFGDGNRQFFTIAQWKSNLIFRAAPQGNDLHDDYNEMSAGDILIKNIPRFLTITSMNRNVKIYIDGRMVKENICFPILPADASATGKFVLGISPTGNGPWTGEILFLAIYDRELLAKEVLHHFRDWTTHGKSTWFPNDTATLIFPFDERMGITARNQLGNGYDISIPATFHVLNKTIFRLPWHEKNFDRPFIRDVVVNVLGFLLFGFFFAYWLRNDDGLPKKSHIFVITSLGSGISLIIESLQIYIPTRTSSFTDIICNISGTILGVFVLRWLLLFLGLERKVNLQ